MIYFIIKCVIIIFIVIFKISYDNYLILFVLVYFFEFIDYFFFILLSEMERKIIENSYLFGENSIYYLV